MKQFILLLISLFLASCGKESETTIENEITPLDTNAIVFTPADAQGNLISKRKIKPLNGMGNGPLYVYRDGCFMYDWTDAFDELNVPIIRFHDVEYFNAGNEAVNISAIFPDGEADAALESSYNFGATDQLMKAAVATGARIIFRLGENILNFASATGSNTPPTDFDKWAHVAERIVAHYEDGWNDGYFHVGSVERAGRGQVLGWTVRGLLRVLQGGLATHTRPTPESGYIAFVGVQRRKQSHALSMDP